MKLLIILLAMAAAAGGALHSWHSRTLYVRAALLSEAFSLVAPIQLRVSDHFLQHRLMPHDNAEAGLPPPKAIYGTSVRRVAVGRGGVLTVDFEERVGARSMTFTPTIGALGGHLAWNCTSDSIERGVLERLRPACHYLPATRESRLMHAIANRDEAALDRLLEEGARPDAVVNGNTPLMLAAKSGGTAIVKRLLAAGAHVDNGPLDLERRTPLMVAITSDEADVVALLLARGASVSQKDHRGLSALDHARATDRRLGGERYVLMTSARLNPRFAGRHGSVEALSAGSLADPPDAREALHLAVRRESRLAALHGELRAAARDCHVQRLASLLREEGDLDAPELVAGEPLATQISKPECRDRLAAHLDGKVSYRAARAAALRAAVRSCDQRRASAMLRAEPDIDVLAAEGGPSPFEQAVTLGCEAVVSPMVRERELNGRLDPEILLRAIREAPQGTLVRLVGTLIAAGADVDVRDAAGRTPLGEAIALEQPVVAKYLVDAGADIEARTANGSRPLIEATKKGYGHLVSELLELGADVGSRDELGRTALHAAVAGGRGRLVDSLLRAGADARRRDGNGVDAVLLAESRNLRQIRTILVASGEP